MGTVLKVDTRKTSELLRTSEDDRRKQMQMARAEVALSVQQAVEQQLATKTSELVTMITAENGESEQRWLAREQAWHAREAELVAQRDQLRADFAAQGKRLEEALAQVHDHDEAAANLKRQMATRHAAAMERTAGTNSGLRDEASALQVQLATLRDELRRAEHEGSMERMEAEAAKDAVADAARELVPLRQTVVEMKQEQVEFARATSALKHAKDEDNASYLIAKRTTARLLKRRHLKALDTAVAQHKEQLRQAALAREREEAEWEKKAARMVSDNSGAWELEVAKREREAEMKRRELQAALAGQIAGEVATREKQLAEEHERALDNERMAASARLVQTHQRLRHSKVVDQAQLAREYEMSTAQMLQQYATDAQGKLDMMIKKSVRYESELHWVKNEVNATVASLEGMGDMLSTMLHEASSGWTASEAKLEAALAEISEWKEKARVADQARADLAKASGSEMSGVLAAHAVYAKAYKHEIHDLEMERLGLLHWRSRAEYLSEELNALTKAHQLLMQEQRDEKVEAKAEDARKEKLYKEETNALKEELEELKMAYASAQRTVAETSAANGSLTTQLETTTANLATMRYNMVEAMNLRDVISHIMHREFVVDDEKTSRTEAVYHAMEKRLNASANAPIHTLAVAIKDIEAEFVEVERAQQMLKKSMGDELEWQRNETRKVKAMVDASKNEAVQAVGDKEKAVAEITQQLADEKAEAKAALRAAENKEERHAWLLECEEKAHEETRQSLNTTSAELDEERKEAAKLRGELSEAREESAAAEHQLEVTKREFERLTLEASDASQEQADYMALANTEIGRLVDLQADTLEALDRAAADFEATDNARIEQWNGKIAAVEEKHDLLQQDRDELQARFDWLVVRWQGREPRQQDVQMMSALQEELSRQMHLTAHAVQTAREYKQALKANDSAYTRLFGLGALLPTDVLRTPEDIEGGGAAPHTQHAFGSARAAAATKQQQQLRETPPKTTPRSQPTVLRVRPSSRPSTASSDVRTPRPPTTASNTGPRATRSVRRGSSNMFDGAVGEAMDAAATPSAAPRPQTASESTRRGKPSPAMPLMSTRLYSRKAATDHARAMKMAEDTVSASGTSAREYVVQPGREARGSVSARAATTEPSEEARSASPATIRPWTAGSQKPQDPVTAAALAAAEADMLENSMTRPHPDARGPMIYGEPMRALGSLTPWATQHSPTPPIR